VFQTDLNHFLQQYDHPAWAGFMFRVSEVGTTLYFLVAVFILFFVIDYRKGYIVLQSLLWITFVTLTLKDFFNMPRPYHVDSDLQLFENLSFHLRIKNGDGSSFFSWLPDETLTRLRNLGKMSNGLPSGHTSTVTAFWVTMSLLLAKRWFILLSATFVMLTMLSRMYLAQHFLGDVLAGLLLGLIPVLIVYFWIIKKDVLAHWLKFNLPKGNWIFYWALPFLLLFLPFSHRITLVQIIGLNMGIWLCCKDGFPLSEGIWWRRILRLVVAVLVFLFVNLVFRLIFPKNMNEWLILTRNLVEFGLVVYLATMLNLYLKLFKGRMAS
jgi:membrane-associated phospholipid phosphatase